MIKSKGIDSVYEVPLSKQPPKTIILDAKFTSTISDKVPSLKGETITNPPQLSNEWILKNINDVVSDNKLASEIVDGLYSGDTARVVGKVDANDTITYYVVGLDGKIVKDAAGKPVIWKP